MKKLFTIAAALVMVCVAANAQLVSGSSYSQEKVKKTERTIKPYNKVMFTYSPLSMTAKYKGEKETESGFNGIGVTYMHGSLLAKFPLYLEFGGGLQYTLFRKHYYYDIASINIPVNLLYRFAFCNGNLHLAPYTGFYGRVNVWGLWVDDKQSHSGSLFDDDGGWKRFQLGWQIGAQFDVSKFYLHIGYLTDITNCYKDTSAKCHLGGVNFGIGVVF